MEELRSIPAPLVVVFERIDVDEIGHGPDPWGGYRRGFSGTTTITLKDYGIDYDLGPAARQAELFLSVEGIRQ